MAKTDFHLLLALLAPLLVWPWVPVADVHLNSGYFSSFVLFTFIPLGEEIVFRGFLQGWLLRQDRCRRVTAGVSGANWLTSLAFAAAHVWQHALLLAPGYLVISLVLGHFRERYRGIAVPVLLHGYYNLGLLIYAAQAAYR